MGARVPRIIGRPASMVVVLVTLSLLILAENCGDVLTRAMMLFRRLNVEIGTLHLVPRRCSETTRISVTRRRRRGGGWAHGSTHMQGRAREVRKEGMRRNRRDGYRSDG